MSSQAKNYTRGGAQERQKVPVLGSSGSLLDLIILYSPDVCRVPFSIANAEFRPSLLFVNTTRDKSSLTVVSVSPLQSAEGQDDSAGLLQQSGGQVGLDACSGCINI